jgi:hypothetical protein
MSPGMVAMVALCAGREAFSDYSHPFRPHKFTEPQLIASSFAYPCPRSRHR